MERLARRLVPSGYWSVEGGPRRLARTFGIALALRLLLMPLSCHSDLISTYHRSWVLLHQRAAGYWVPHELIQSVFLLLYQPILRLDELLAWDGYATASLDFWLKTFAPHPQAVLAIFLFKIPYLLCDLGTAAILLRIFADEPRKGLKAFSLWLFNPITVFAFYVFARHDSVAIFFAALGLLGWTRSRFGRGALAYGVATWSRYWPVFTLPFLVLCTAGSWKRRLQVFVTVLVPISLFNVTEVLLRGPAESNTSALPPAVRMAQSNFASYLIAWDLDMGWVQQLFVFPLVYMMLLLFALVAVPRGNALTRFCTLAASSLLALYATAFFHPQYFTWFIVFLVILMAESQRKVLRNLHLLQVALFVPYTFFWKRSLFGWLFAPLAPDVFVDMRAPSDWIEHFMPALMFVNGVRTAMTTVCLFMIGWLLFGERDGIDVPD